MLQTKQKNLTKVCPQCCKLINSSASRLVHDSCGHSKCRICLLQEITGCLLCNAEEKSLGFKPNFIERGINESCNKNLEPQLRKSVITSVAIQMAEQKETDDTKLSPTIDNDTCHVIKQSLEKDILFPTEIVKRSTGNFYHLKRVFSERFFNEDVNCKRNKGCLNEEKWCSAKDDLKIKEIADSSTEKRNWKLPNHIQVQYYCSVHKLTVNEKEVVKSHMACSMNSEKNDNPLYKCKICDRGYRMISKLNRHMMIHTKNSKFKCGKCGKICTDNYALRTHERTHTKCKPYSCSFCKKKFSGLQNSKRHEKKHKNEKAFMCNECGFQFLTKTELKRHLVTHSNIKSFVCQICSSRFSFKRTLTRHIKTHDVNLIKIKCSYCDSTFKRKDNLERHIKTAHFDVKAQTEIFNN
ncbi:hypothetical protein RUM44_000386 [Polyplax serrata]|uniref:C2H2-type domain-containing protein n=1 Tax=Polyplax serrata TaxID=468196 RepID=A0ABR1B5A0_POLSC